MSDAPIMPLQTQPLAPDESAKVLAALRETDKDSFHRSLAALQTLLEAEIKTVSLREDIRWESQAGADTLRQRALEAALAAAEKAVTAALIASEKAVEKAERAQQLRNESQDEFRQALTDLSALMWTRNEGTSSVASLGREMVVRITAIDEKTTDLDKRVVDRVNELERTSITDIAVRTMFNQSDTVHTALATRINNNEQHLANLDGRIWALGVGLAIITIAINVGLRFIR